MTVYWPNGSLTRPHVTSDYDPARKNPVTGIVQAHNGIDLIGWTDNCSPVDGTVVFAGYNGGAGNEVRIRADGPTAFHVGDYYRILHHASLYVSTGQRVTARQPVGRMGTTGQSTGVHCHFETHEWRLWNPVNPTDYMNRANAGSAAGGDSSPFVPKEWDEMASKDEVKAAVLEALGTRPDAVLIHYSGAGRNGIYLAAPGSWHQFTAEEWKQFSDHGLRVGIREVVPVNDRDFDVLKAIYAPQTTAPATLTDAQLAAIVAQISAETKVDLSDADLDRIAKAVRGQFAADPLK